VRTPAIVAAVAMSLVLATAADASAPKRVPATFVGAVAEGPLLQDPRIDFEAQFDTMVSSGVQTTRTVFNWGQAQPYKTFADVPPDQVSRYRDENGVPTDYAAIDRLVIAAAERRIVILPVLLVAPMWDARHPGVFASPPRDPKPYANFAGALVRRYGPNGAFWKEHPELVRQPIRNWQIWNEPSLTQFWSDQPFAKAYVKLLRLARRAIRGEDKRATVVLAGLPNKSWSALDKIYKAGGRGLFDVAAFHPFTSKVAGVRTILERDREVMAKHGEKHMPLWVTELSWTSAKGKTSERFGNEATESGQAKKVTAAYSMLAALRGKLRIGRVYWYTWLSRDRQHDYPFDWAGLSKVTSKGNVKHKPAFAAFRRIALELEHCRSKRHRADRCAT
jgi:hypothetical protein